MFKGPPDKIAEMGTFLHACEGDMVCLSTNKKIPYFNATIYLENKQSIGKVDEILGPMNEVYFTVKLQEGIVATSFKPDDKVYIGEDKLLPLERFLPKPPAPKIKGQRKGSNVRSRGRGSFRGRGGNMGFRGGNMGFRGGRVAQDEISCEWLKPIKN
ncbi:15854_t:CDS:2 [Cetraspora pellucida]|uniref:15854_t:CDS:1 n=1 Tax=Cetraspora pellucida TaxID=1433469 RepID=A0ACA9MWQ8_9GLOM|nr:15854_t:CDS:2 [Cetraspora pellucida]